MPRGRSKKLKTSQATISTKGHLTTRSMTHHKNDDQDNYVDVNQDQEDAQKSSIKARTDSFKTPNGNQIWDISVRQTVNQTTDTLVATRDRSAQLM